jgi:hypothetical protein
MNRPNSRRNLDAALQRRFGAEQGYIKTRALMANTIVGQLLPNGAVKGGTAIKLRLGDASTRFTSDLDVVRTSTLDEFIGRLDKSLSEGWGGFTGRVIAKMPAEPKGIPGAYVMQPFDIKLDYNGKPWVTVSLEVGYDEIGDADECEWGLFPEIAEFFASLGFSEPKPVALMPLHHQVAQKLHAVSYDGSPRAHDLIDLQLITRDAVLDYHLMRNTCIRLFDYRRMQTWPPEIKAGDKWPELYDSQANGLPVLNTVEEAVAWTNDFIKRIDIS